MRAIVFELATPFTIGIDVPDVTVDCDALVSSIDGASHAPLHTKEDDNTLSQLSTHPQKDIIQVHHDQGNSLISSTPFDEMVRDFDTVIDSGFVSADRSRNGSRDNGSCKSTDLINPIHELNNGKEVTLDTDTPGLIKKPREIITSALHSFNPANANPKTSMDTAKMSAEELIACSKMIRNAMKMARVKKVCKLDHETDVSYGIGKMDMVDFLVARSRQLRSTWRHH